MSLDILDLVKSVGSTMSKPAREAWVRTMAEKLETYIKGRDFTDVLSLFEYVWKGSADALLGLDPSAYTMFFSLFGNAIEEIPLVKNNYAWQAAFLKMGLEHVGTGVGGAFEHAAKSGKKFTPYEFEEAGKDALGVYGRLLSLARGGASDSDDEDEDEDEVTEQADRSTMHSASVRAPRPASKTFLERLVEERKMNHYAALVGAAMNAIQFDADMESLQKEAEEKSEDEKRAEALRLSLLKSKALDSASAEVLAEVAESPEASEAAEGRDLDDRAVWQRYYVPRTLSWFTGVIWNSFSSAWEVATDFVDIFSFKGKAPERLESLDGSGNQLLEAIAKMSKDNPNGFLGILEADMDADDIERIQKDPLNLKTGSYSQIVTLLVLHKKDASYPARFWDWADHVVDKPHLKRFVAKRTKVIGFLAFVGAGVAAFVSFLGVLVASPGTLVKGLKGVGAIPMAIMSFVARWIFGPLSIMAMLATAYFGVLNLLYGWGLTESISITGVLNFMIGARTPTVSSITEVAGLIKVATEVVPLTMHADAMTRGFALVFIARVLTGPIDKFTSGINEDGEKEAPRELIISKVSDKLGFEPEAAAIPKLTPSKLAKLDPEERKALKEEELELERKKKDVFTGAKLRRIAVTLMMVICILQLIGLGRWLLLFFWIISWADVFTWAGATMVTVIGTLVETMARFPAFYDFEEKKSMLKKGIDKIMKWGLMPATIGVIVVFLVGLPASFIGYSMDSFQQSNHGMLLKKQGVPTDIAEIRNRNLELIFHDNAKEMKAAEKQAGYQRDDDGKLQLITDKKTKTSSGAKGSGKKKSSLERLCELKPGHDLCS